jgi:DNA-binding response OmpR family regulator
LLTAPGEEQKLTKKEAEILKLLCAQKGDVIPRELVLNMIWGDDNYFNGRSLDVFLTKIRKYLKSDPNVSIVNVHGVGFKLQVAEN